jgi:hypothetical protein
MYAPLAIIARVNVMFCPCHIDLRYWLWPLKFVTEPLKGSPAMEVRILGLSHVPVSRSRME